MEQQWIFLITAVFGVELARVERRIEVARIGVGVAIHRGARAIQRLLNVVDADQGFGIGRASLTGKDWFNGCRS